MREEEGAAGAGEEVGMVVVVEAGKDVVVPRRMRREGERESEVSARAKRRRGGEPHAATSRAQLAVWLLNETVNTGSTSQPSSCSGNEAALLPARGEGSASSRGRV